MPYIWPWPKGTRISQEFGSNPSNGINPVGGHTGKDGVLDIGTPLRAPGDGEIVYEGFPGPNYLTSPWWLTDGAGLVVVLDCGDSEPTFIMGHLSETYVNVGQRVNQGDIIAASGNTGKWTTGPHCHFEVLLPGYVIGSSTYGRTDPNLVCRAYFEDLDPISIVPAGDVTKIDGPGTRTVTTEGANVRLAPFSDAPKAPGYEDGLALGAQLAVIGYVKGEEVTQGNNAWYKTKSGYFVWANAAGDNIDGLEFLGEVSRPAPAPAPAPTPDPVPSPQPDPVPVEEKYDFALDFTQINGIAVEKIPAQWYNYGEDFPEKPEKAVLHWWNSLENRPDIESVINEFCYIRTEKSPHFMVSDERIIQIVSLADRAFHAGPGGNNWVGIEVDPRAIEKNADGSYTARALRIQANVRGLLQALKVKYGYKLSLTLHKDVPGAATACSDLVLSDFEIDTALPEPTTPTPDPVVVIEPDPTVDKAAVLREFSDWLITQYLNRKEK